MAISRRRRELEAVIEALGARGVRGVFGGPGLEELDGPLVMPSGFDPDLIVGRRGSLVVDEPPGHAKPLPVASD